MIAPGAVLHQHVVGHEHRDLLAVHRVGDGAPERHAGLLPCLVAALLGRLADRAVDVVAHLRRVVEPEDVGVLGRHDEEGRAEERVGTRGEDRVVDAELLAAERDLGALGAADPVLLHGHHVRRPLDVVDVLEQPVGVLGDAEEPLLELAHLDQRAAALAAAVDHLLVGQDGLVVGAPLDRRLLAVGEAALEQAQEDPLGPAVVARLVRAELARPVDRDAPPPELLLELRRSTPRWTRAGAARS